jgi:hypothetical protein
MWELLAVVSISGENASRKSGAAAHAPANIDVQWSNWLAAACRAAVNTTSLGTISISIEAETSTVREK